MAAYRGGFENDDDDDEDSCMSCLDTTKHRCHRCKFLLCYKCSLSEENDEIPGWKAGKFVAYCVPWARACLLYMHESSLLTYLHIPSVFHNQRPCNGYRELYSGRNIDFALKNHCQRSPLFLFLWCSSSVRLN